MKDVERQAGASESVSIIIPTRNRSRDLADTIRTVLAQTVLPDEILVIDQSSSDEGMRLVENLFSDASECVRARTKVVYVLDSTIPGLTTARNRGIAAARGDIILFLDDDVLLEPNFLDELMNVYRVHPEASGVSGVVTNYWPPSAVYRMWDSMFMLGRLHDDRQPVYWTSSMLSRRTPVRVTRLGGGLMSFRASNIRGFLFDENLRGVSDGEDVDFCVRLGPEAALFIAPTARLIHNQSPHGREQGHWLRRHARGTVYLYRRNWNRGVWNRACIAWLNVGYSVAAMMACSYRLSLQPWQAYLDGRREGMLAAGVTSATEAGKKWIRVPEGKPSWRPEKDPE